MTPQNFDLDVLRSAVTIADVLTDAGYAVPTGTRMACPICDGENRQAFSIHGEYWRCFRCHEHGDAITLTMKLHRVPFKAAITRLAALAGLTDVPVQDAAVAIARRRQRDQQRQDRIAKGQRELLLATMYWYLDKTARSVGAVLAHDTDNGAVWDALATVYRQRDGVEAVMAGEP